MSYRAAFWLLALSWAHPLCAQYQIQWLCVPNKTNLTSTGQSMNAGFRFELGVFNGDFVPTPANLAQWAENWNRAGERQPYLSNSNAFIGSYNVPPNAGQFTFNKKVYVWGFRGDAGSAEWILFSDPDWLWPNVDENPPPAPVILQWYAQVATPVLGEINASGVPFLMKSAAVTQVAPPDTTWEQWQAEIPNEEPLKGPQDDPDQDGIPNLLEFVFGTAPTAANAPVSTPVSLDSSHLVIAIPRRIDHKSTLTVEVSGNLVDWDSGPTHTQTLADDAGGLVVRDLTPVDPAHPKQFIRLKASLP